MNFMAMVGKASLFLNWDHHTTSKSEEIKVFATIFPQVSSPPPLLPSTTHTHTH